MQGGLHVHTAFNLVFNGLVITVAESHLWPACDHLSYSCYLFLNASLEWSLRFLSWYFEKLIKFHALTSNLCTSLLASKLKIYPNVAKISHPVAIKGFYAFLITFGFKLDDILKNYFCYLLPEHAISCSLIVQTINLQVLGGNISNWRKSNV